MSFEPEQFSHMNIQPMEKIDEQPSSKAQAMSDDQFGQQEDGKLCLDQDLSTLGMRGRSTSDTSTFTGESASTLLSLSSADGTCSYPRSRSPSPPMVFHPAEGGLDLPGSPEDHHWDPSLEVHGPTQPSRDAVYVTMSSFYHSKGPEKSIDSH
ncbi:unnamed protein product [Merluccius merluccius]